LKNKKKEKKESWGKRFLKWIDKAAKKEPPKCGGDVVNDS